MAFNGLPLLFGEFARSEVTICISYLLFVSEVILESELLEILDLVHAALSFYI